MKEKGFLNKEGYVRRGIESKERDLSLIRSLSEELIARAHEDIEGRYRREEGDALERREYHNVEHTKGVEEKAELILRTIQNADPSIGVTNRDIIVARLIASYHDIDQRQDDPKISSEKIGEGEFQKKMRARRTIRIEKNSAGILIRRMKESNKKEGKVIFTEEDQRVAREAIEATIPYFIHGTIIQPYLKEDASLITQAVALADLGAVIDGGEEFLKDGDRVFREDNIDIAEILDKQEDVSNEQKEFICKRIKDWYTFQIGFVEGRKEIFELQILSFPETVKEEVKKLFKFDEAIQAARKRLDVLEDREKHGDKPSFEEMMRSMGYTLSD
ncbi:MAG: hypothetical protein HZA35_04045 [Parcubacteria group bacterium]|nr:hypothetical protein [Parcubacteria group bacterium]